MTTPEPLGPTPAGTGRWKVVGWIVIAGLIPPGLYWLCLGRVATVLPDDAKRMLRDRGDSTVLVDIRPAERFQHRHIDGARHWPANQILAVRSPEDVPPGLRDKRLLLVCSVGMLSARTAEHLADVGLSDAFSVRGGIQAWIGTASGPRGGPYDRWRTGSGEVVQFPVRQASPWEQLLAVASGFAMKGTYTLVSLILIVLLWRHRAADLVALRWAMVFFFLGENCCAINYFMFGEKSYLLEYLHSFGMLLCFAFTTYALIEGIDTRLIGISDPKDRCAAVSLCGQCAKYTDAPCGLRRIFYLIIPVMMVLAGMLLTSGRHDVSYNAMIYGTFYNYSHPMIYQLFETVYCPLAAMVVLAVSMGILLFKKRDPLPPAKATLAAGTGALGFGTLRMVLVGGYEQNMMWFVFWEEATELIFIAGVCCVLWLFRRGLLAAPTTPPDLQRPASDG